MKTKLHHLALGARDPECVAAFYRDLLGLRELKRQFDPSGKLCSVWLDLGGPILMIETTEEPLRHTRDVGAGPFLIALIYYFVKSSRGATIFKQQLQGALWKTNPEAFLSTCLRSLAGLRPAL